MELLSKQLKDQLDKFPMTAAIYYAIMYNADKAADYIFSTKKEDLSFFDMKHKLIALAYQNDALNIAKNLVLNGVHFSAPYLTFSHPEKHNLTQYIDHIGSLSEVITATSAEQGMAIVNSLVSGPLLEVTSIKCLNNTYIFASYTYVFPASQSRKTLQIYESFEFSKSNIVSDTLTATSLALLTQQNTKIILPNVLHAQREAVYNIMGDYQSIYMPLYKYDKLESGQFMHEIGHYIQSFLFHNNAKPYLTNDNKAELDYKAVFHVVLDMAVKMVHNPLAASKISHQCKITNSEYSQKMMDCLAQNSNLVLYLFPSKKNDHGFIDDCVMLFPPHSNMKIQEDNFLWKKLYIEKYYLTIAEEQGLKISTLLVLDRVIEAYFYPDQNAEAELIVRLAELYVKDMSQNIEDILAPLAEYWRIHISPVIDQTKYNKNIPNCDLSQNSCLLSGDIIEVLPEGLFE